MMGGNGGVNAARQMGRRGGIGLGLKRLFYDSRTWRNVRGTWSGGTLALGKWVYGWLSG
jgi:hypothetical protein